MSPWFGTSSLHVSAVGDDTEIGLASNWPHPAFAGGRAPDERRVAPEGFEARWRATHLATGGSDAWEKLAC